MIYAIDFDDTIHDRAHPAPGRRMGPPLPDAVRAVRALWDGGHRIIIHTTMALEPSGLRAVEDWLAYFDVPYDEIAAKPHADRYIDDKGLQHIDWERTLRELE